MGKKKDSDHFRDILNPCGEKSNYGKIGRRHRLSKLIFLKKNHNFVDYHNINIIFYISYFFIAVLGFLLLLMDMFLDFIFEIVEWFLISHYSFLFLFLMQKYKFEGK